MPEITQEELDAFKAAQEKANALSSKVERLEGESKKYKTRAQEAEEKISNAEKAKLEEQGELEKLLQAEREENKKTKSQLEKTQKGVITEKLRTEALKHADDVHDVDMLLKISSHMELLKIDEENLDVSGMDDFVAKARESHGYLFKQTSGQQGPEGKPNIKGEPEGDDAYYEALEKATTRKEMDEVRKKYGKL